MTMTHSHRVAAGAAAGLMAIAPSSARAADADTGEPKPDADGRPSEVTAPGTSHLFQFGLRMGYTQGFRMVFRRPESPLCREPDRTFDYRTQPDDYLDEQQLICGFLGAPGLDVALSFAPLGAIEPFVWMRFGLDTERETDTEAQILLGVGARVYTTTDTPLKIFIQPAAALSFEGSRGRPEYQVNDPDYGTEILLSAGAGMQYDFTQNVGMYGSGTMLVGIERAIHAELGWQLGVQVRVP